MLLAFGGGEIVVLLLVVLFGVIVPVLAYKAGSVRTIGGTLGLVLALVFNVIGLIIVYLFPKVDKVVVNDIPDQLKKYKELLDSGVITEAEFQIQKDRLLK